MIAQQKFFDALTTPQITRTHFEGVFLKKLYLTVNDVQMKLDPFYPFGQTQAEKKFITKFLINFGFGLDIPLPFRKNSKQSCLFPFGLPLAIKHNDDGEFCKISDFF